MRTDHSNPAKGQPSSCTTQPFHFLDGLEEVKAKASPREEVTLAVCSTKVVSVMSTTHQYGRVTGNAAFCEITMDKPSFSVM